MPLTDTKIKNLAPKEKQYKKSDFDGLYILVKPTGSKLWRFKYRFLGKEKLLAIGRYPDISLKHARTLRDEARSNVANGIDPNEEKQEQLALAKQKASNSFELVAQAYFIKITNEGRAKSTLSKVNQFITKANKAFGYKPITSITSPMVLRCLRKEENKGHYETAQRLRSTIGAIFRYAVANCLADTDPTAALKDALTRPIVTPRAAITDKIGLAGVSSYSHQSVQVNARLATIPLIPPCGAWTIVETK